jgi:PHD/YefM family antitoxin component YafN of YafNO toxin-antitoxin module
MKFNLPNFAVAIHSKTMSNVQFVTDAKGQKTGVLLSMEQYEKMLEELEELADTRDFDKAKRSKLKSRPFREFLKEVKESQS